VTGIASTLATIWRLAIPYFRSEDRWPGRVLLAAVIVALRQAVYVYAQTVYEGQRVVVDAWMILWFAVAAGICAAATVIPLWMGLRRMEGFEF